MSHLEDIADTVESIDFHRSWMHEHQRFMVRYIDRARNDGHTWGDIAEAMGLKHAAGAATWYRRHTEP